MTKAALEFRPNSSPTLVHPIICWQYPDLIEPRQYDFASFGLVVRHVTSAKGRRIGFLREELDVESVVYSVLPFSSVRDGCELLAAEVGVAEGTLAIEVDHAETLEFEA